MTNDQEKQWREEFHEAFSVRPRPLNVYNDFIIESKWKGYLEARKKAQEENKNEWVKNQETFWNMKNSLRDEIQKYADRDTQRVLDLKKRDKLIEQAKPWLKDFYNEFSCIVTPMDEVIQWLKEVEELK